MNTRQMIRRFLSIATRYKVSSIAVIFSIVLLIAGLWWFGILILILSLSYSAIIRIPFFKKSTLARGCFNLLAIVFLAIITRIFVFEIYTIPSESMYSELLIGDNVIVSKLHYGPRMPAHPAEISWINIFFKRYTADRPWPYKRLPGFGKVKRGDIVVFNDVKNSTALVKRCMGLPGDNILIKENSLFVNDIKQLSDSTVHQAYRIWFKNKEAIKVVFRKLSISPGIFPYKNGFRSDLQLTDPVKKKLETYDMIDSVRSLAYGAKLSCWNDELNWTSKDMGPYFIPSKGSVIKLNFKNYLIYDGIIRDFEKVKIQYTAGNFFLNGKLITHFTFSNNYFFMLGDNRGRSNDSRFWGVIPEKHITGKAIALAYSKNESFIWARFLKLL